MKEVFTVITGTMGKIFLKRHDNPHAESLQTPSLRDNVKENETSTSKQAVQEKAGLHDEFFF